MVSTRPVDFRKGSDGLAALVRKETRSDLEPVSTDIRTGLCPRAGIPAGKMFAEARDQGGILGDNGRFPAAETALSRVPGGKATESQRLFRRRQETVFACDCMVGLAGLKLATKRLWNPS
jgi:hypothetical protein